MTGSPSPPPIPIDARAPRWLRWLHALLEQRRKHWAAVKAKRAQARMARQFNREADRLILMANLLEQSPHLRLAWRRALRVRGIEEVSNPTFPKSAKARRRRAVTDPRHLLATVKEAPRDAD